MQWRGLEKRSRDRQGQRIVMRRIAREWRSVEMKRSGIEKKGEAKQWH